MALGWRDPPGGLDAPLGPRLAVRGRTTTASVLEARGITVSMSRKGDCWDNAPMESVNGTVKVECVHGEHFRHARQALSAHRRVHRLLQHRAASFVAGLHDPERIRAALARRGNNRMAGAARCESTALPTAGRSGSSQATEPAVRGQRFQPFVASEQGTGSNSRKAEGFQLPQCLGGSTTTVCGTSRGWCG